MDLAPVLRMIDPKVCSNHLAPVADNDQFHNLNLTECVSVLLKDGNTSTVLIGCHYATPSLLARATVAPPHRSRFDTKSTSREIICSCLFSGQTRRTYKLVKRFRPHSEHSDCLYDPQSRQSSRIVAAGRTEAAMSRAGAVSLIRPTHGHCPRRQKNRSRRKARFR